MIKVTAAAGTHVGKVRDNNEDNFYINGFYKEDVEEENCIYADDREHDVYTYAVCDGVGGAEFGELASLHAVETLKDYDGADIQDRMEEYVAAANDRICRDIKDNQGKRMGSTLTLLTIRDGKTRFCNVGDSRIYSMRNGTFTRLSHDHTRLQKLIDSGKIDVKDGRPLKKDHVLTQFLGVFPHELILDPYIDEIRELCDGDLFLISSDGLTDMVPDDHLGQLLLEHGSKTPEEIVKALIDTAVENGGRDNVTAIIVKVSTEETGRIHNV